MKAKIKNMRLKEHLTAACTVFSAMAVGFLLVWHLFGNPFSSGSSTEPGELSIITDTQGQYIQCYKLNRSISCDWDNPIPESKVNKSSTNS